MRRVDGLWVRAGLVLALFAGVPSSPASGQERCAYEACALRIENSRLLQGADGRVVGEVSPIFHDLRILQAGSDSAVAYADEYRSRARRSSVASLVSMAMIGAGALLTRNDPERVGPALGLSAAGIAASIYGGLQQARGRVAISRSIWWFNESVASTGAAPELDPARPYDPRHRAKGAFTGAVTGASVGLVATARYSDPGAALGAMAAYTGGGAVLGWLTGWLFGR